MYFMISLYDTVSVIQSEFPYLSYQMHNASNNKNVLQAVSNLANYAKDQILEHNHVECEHCFRVAHDIFEHGSNISRLAIENVFVYSLSRLLEQSLSASNESREQFLKFFRKQYEIQIGAKYP